MYTMPPKMIKFAINGDFSSVAYLHLTVYSVLLLCAHGNNIVFPCKLVRKIVAYGVTFLTPTKHKAP